MKKIDENKYAELLDKAKKLILGESSPQPFKNLNFKLVIIQELMHVQKILKIKF